MHDALSILLVGLREVVQQHESLLIKIVRNCEYMRKFQDSHQDAEIKLMSMGHVAWSEQQHVNGNLKNFFLVAEEDAANRYKNKRRLSHGKLSQYFRLTSIIKRMRQVDDNLQKWNDCFPNSNTS